MPQPGSQYTEREQVESDKEEWPEPESVNAVTSSCASSSATISKALFALCTAVLATPARGQGNELATTTTSTTVAAFGAISFSTQGITLQIPWLGLMISIACIQVGIVFVLMHVRKQPEESEPDWSEPETDRPQAEPGIHKLKRDSMLQSQCSYVSSQNKSVRRFNPLPDWSQVGWVSEEYDESPPVLYGRGWEAPK